MSHRYSSGDTGTAKSLPFLAYEAADGDPLLALLLALDYIEKFGRSEPEGRGAALDTPTSSPLAGSPRGTPASDLLEEAA